MGSPVVCRRCVLTLSSLLWLFCPLTVAFCSQPALLPRKQASCNDVSQALTCGRRQNDLAQLIQVKSSLTNHNDENEDTTVIAAAAESTVSKCSTMTTRREALSQAAASVAVVFLSTAPAAAQAPPVSQQKAFDLLRNELNGEKGSVALLSRTIQEQNYAKLLVLTRYLDESLRKEVMGICKYYVASENKGLAQQLCNNVTFDLIGINKASRPGQESAENATKYLEILKTDIQQMLDLEPPAN